MSEDNKSIELRPIGKLKDTFFIPDYQRGYRWVERQVTELLDDILEFIQRGEDGKRGEDRIYCIQPLVVKKDNANAWWEVIDGQQRLTTIYILLGYLCKGATPPYSIKYATRQTSKEREGSESFLKELIKSNDDDSNINNDNIMSKANKNIDFFHMYKVNATIRDWFNKQNLDELSKIKRADYLKALNEQVQFIWYETTEENPIRVFTRLNIGKIPLTDAELVKALFLNHSNFGEDKAEDAIRLQQQEIAADWDRIEFKLQDDKFWMFLNNNMSEKPTHIDFILNIVREQDALGLKDYWQQSQREVNNDQEKASDEDWKKYLGNDEHQTFRYFYNYFKFHQDKIRVSEDGFRLRDDIWSKVKNVYQIFEEWFDDVKLYHYIGYLIVNGDAILGLLDLWNNAGKDKESFKSDLIGRIIEKIDKCKDLSRTYGDGGENKRESRPLLLLFNIQTTINQNLIEANADSKQLGMFYRFPFSLYKNESWDVEHIDSMTTNDFDDTKSREEYLLVNYQIVSPKLQEDIRNYFTNGQQGDSFHAIKDCIEKEFQNVKERDQFDKNQVWNYALLDKTTNRGYGNAIFPAKRRAIMGKDQRKIFPIPKLNNDGTLLQGEAVPATSAFVPPCTKAVFMKYYSPLSTDPTRYTKTDAEGYKEAIYEALKVFGVTKTQGGK